MAGDLDRAAELYQRLVDRSPEEAEISNLGVVYLLLKRYDAAAEAFRRALDLSPSSPHASLNLADALWLLGDREQAQSFYRRTIDRAYKDPNPDSLRTVTAQAMARVGQVEEAIALTQEALIAAPENPQIAYEASVVFAAAGEQASAAVHARRAIELGVELRWFDFAWFDPIRNRLD